MLDKHSEIDVVSIITPSGMHFEHASDIIDNYIREASYLKSHNQVIFTFLQSNSLSLPFVIDSKNVLG